jgi:hypothetical protein
MRKQRMNKMVERMKFEKIEEFDGRCEKIEIVEGTDDFEGTKQIHMAITPLDEPTKEKVADSKTKQLHNFISLKCNVDGTKVADGSNIEKYLIEIESLIPAAKKAATIIDAFRYLEKQPLHYVNKKLGKSFKGFEGKCYYVPQHKI